MYIYLPINFKRMLGFTSITVWNMVSVLFYGIVTFAITHTKLTQKQLKTGSCAHYLLSELLGMRKKGKWSQIICPFNVVVIR